MTGKISIRNIPMPIWNALESLANEHDRSTEAEARFALRAWVEPFIMQNERSARRAEVSERLRSLLDQVNRARVTPLRPSHVAQAIGENYVEQVEDWFLGKVEPSFSQLALIASSLGAVAQWLQHGDAQMFPAEYHRLSEDATEAVEWLMTWGGVDSEEKVSAIHFVREASKTGGLVIVKESDKEHSKTYRTPYHVSDVIGNGGESSLAHLWVMFELLYKYYTKNGMQLMVKSHLLKPSDYDAISGGNTNPLAILKSASASTWWEDIWDKNMYPKQNYWTGWVALCEAIGRSVNSRPRLVDELEKIRKGEHPFLARRP